MAKIFEYHLLIYLSASAMHLSEGDDPIVIRLIFLSLRYMYYFFSSAKGNDNGFVSLEFFSTTTPLAVIYTANFIIPLQSTTSHFNGITRGRTPKALKYILHSLLVNMCSKIEHTAIYTAFSLYEVHSLLNVNTYLMQHIIVYYTSRMFVNHFCFYCYIT